MENRISLLTFSVLTFTLIVSFPTFAETLNFNDDFSKNSLRFTVDPFREDRTERNYDVQQDRIVITTATKTEEQSDSRLHVWGRSDSITARVSLSSATILPDDENARAKIFVGGGMYNEVRDGGFDDRSSDVNVTLEIALSGNGDRWVGFCLDRNLGNGNFEPANVINGDNCDNFDNFVPQFDTPYTLSVSIDREAGVLTVRFDNMTRVVNIGQPVFIPSFDRKEVRPIVRGLGGKSIVSIFAAGNDNYYQDFSIESPVIGPYRPFYSLEDGNRSLEVIDGQARLEVLATEAQENLSVTLFGESESIEATLTLSSESVLNTDIDPESFAQIRLGGTFYNDTASQPANGLEGNVFSRISIQATDVNSLRLDYCAFRSNNEDFSEASSLIVDDDLNCLDFGIIPEFDTPYRVGIRLDEARSRLIYTVNDIQREFEISTPIYQPQEQFISVQARSNGEARTVAYVDNYRTSSDAPLISGEMAVVEETDEEVDADKVGFVFSRTDKEELRWIAIDSSGQMGSVWIDQACANSLGGVAASGDWFDLLLQAPGIDTVKNPCENLGRFPLDNRGYVFSRTDVNELRWVAPDGLGGIGSIWIDERCANSLGGASASGNWFELLRVAPQLDSIQYPCTAAGSIPSDPAGYVFSRTDTDELRWIAPDETGTYGSTWINQTCAQALGGATVSGDWFDLLNQAPGFDTISSPCP